MSAAPTRRNAPSLAPRARNGRTAPAIDHLEVETKVREILNRHAAVGLAVGVIRGGRLEFFHGHGLANIASGRPITEDTVFRIGSITKTVTAIAVMQLWEQGLVELDAPATEYLRAYQLVPAKAGWRPATVRHLLTHSAGIPDVRRVSDLLHAGLTPSDGRPPLLNVAFGEPLPPLAEYYRDGLQVVVAPGSAFAYSNPSFATLGQIVEDVSGQPLDRYFREHIFEPLDLIDSDLVRTERIASRLATGYAFGRRGATPVPDRDFIGAAAGGIYSTPPDMARYVAALLGGGANEHGRVLQSSTLATMFEAHFQPDPRVPGMGLGFFRGDVGGHPVVYHDGILPGFNAELLIAPDDGIGVFAVTNGSSGAFAWLQVELDRLLRHLLGVPEDGARDVAHHPEVWATLSGRYVLPPRIADLRERLMLGGGVEVFVRGGRLMARVLTPVPALYRGLPLEPSDETDPYVFRLDLTAFGMAPVRVVFGPVVDGRATAAHTDVGGQPWSLVRREDPVTGRRWLWPALGALAAACLVRALRRRGRGKRRRPACRSTG
jgi:CubicO group peptidase (beta-lactamase class C family)